MRKYMQKIKGLLSNITNNYVDRVKSDYLRRKKHPVRMMLLDISKGLAAFAIIVLMFIVTTPVFRSMTDYAIENFTTYNRKIDDLTQQVKDAREDMVDAAIRTLKEFKNPSFDGIRFGAVKGIQSVYPISSTIQEKGVFFHLAKWAGENGYDAVIFGESYSGLNGTFYWTDGKNNQYDTDMELVINMLKEKGCKKIMSFVSNPEYKNYIPYVTNYINGLFDISEVQNYRLEILSSKFWKTNKSTIIRADNFNAEIVDNELLIASRPEGNKNIATVYSRQRKSVIENFKDAGLDATKKIKALMNMADVVVDK